MNMYTIICCPAAMLCYSLMAIVFSNGTPPPESCLPQPFADLSGVDSVAGNEHLPFRFPLDSASCDTSPSYTEFCSRSSWTESKHLYHTAEDFLRQAGTPVYAIGDGQISFSGTMNGYGWLIIIDHPQANLYSLYGHLSPSRRVNRSGLVKKGELIAYLGESHENGGTIENPLVPHLHLGIRAGQLTDYSSIGECRWMAGWVKSCPPDLGWLKPSEIITSQIIPIGGFPDPTLGFFKIWWNEMLMASILIGAGIFMLIFVIKKDKYFLLVIFGILLFTAGIVFIIRHRLMISYAVFAMSALYSSVWIIKIFCSYTKKLHSKT